MQWQVDWSEIQTGLESGRELFTLQRVLHSADSVRFSLPIVEAIPFSMNEAVPIEISVEQVRQLMDGGDEFLLLDCREPPEYQWCHLDGSQLIPLGQIPEQAGSLGQSNRRIVVYCHHGIRSLRAARWLRQQGYVRAQSMAGGIDEWSIEIDPGLPRY